MIGNPSYYGESATSAGADAQCNACVVHHQAPRFHKGSYKGEAQRTRLVFCVLFVSMVENTPMPVSIRKKTLVLIHL